VSQLGAERLFAAGLQIATAIVFAVVAPIFGRARRTLFPDAPVLRWLPHPTWFIATLYLLKGALYLVPPELHRVPPLPLRVTYAGCDVLMLVSIPQVRQILRIITTSDWRPDARWLRRNYTPALALGCLGVLLHLPPPTVVPRPIVFWYEVAAVLFLGLMGASMLRDLGRVARPGAQTAVGMGGPRLLDMRFWAAAVVLVVVGAALAIVGRGAAVSPILYSAVGLLFVVPVVLSALCMVVRGVLFTLSMAACMTAVLVLARFWEARTTPELEPLLAFGTVATLVLCAIAGQHLGHAVIDRVIFRRSRDRAAELQAIVQALSPELGVVECSRRALAELCRVMQVRGAAILLADGAAISHGDFVADRVAALWPRGRAGEALPARLAAPEFGMLAPELRDALIAARTVGVIAIASPHRRWGHLLATTSMLRWILTENDVQALLAFADQLALVLDAAELLARALSVERSLAHAEKLAAIGELAARIAHEIRNPITAARSLTQQLARETPSPFTVEHGLILAELERVERQVASLLRFARRDEFRFAAVDLGALVRQTVEGFQSRLTEAGIGVTLETSGEITAHADREKIRQVLINLIENSIDALDGDVGAKCLALTVSRRNGAATIRVTDSGPGVTADLLPHLFEPFFSRKERGTGLGLAIVKRTIDAHGGRVEARAERGMTIEIELPLESALSGPDDERFPVGADPR
jgi:signal transduction histidine kinase